MNTPNLVPEHEALLIRWQDGCVLPAEEAALAELLDSHPGLAEQSVQWNSIRSLLQTELPRELDPPSPDFFTSQIMREVAAAVSPTKSSRAPWWQFWKTAWLAPVVATVLVLATGLFLQMRQNRVELASGPYSPDPNVVATLEFHEEANATVLDLNGLHLEDSKDIRPFSIASSDEPSEAGEPLKFYASNDPAHLVVTLGWDGSTRPVILERTPAIR